MIEELQSDALKANLSQTKIGTITIPAEHQWFLSISEKYWGIHKRMQEFFTELHHPYSNKKVVIDLLVYVSISDFWIYKDLDPTSRERAFKDILQIFDKLLKESLPDEFNKHLVYIYLDFFPNNYDSLAEFDSIPSLYIKILEENLDENLFSYLSNIGYFKNALGKAAENPKTKDEVLSFMRKLVQKNINFWETTTKFEQWYEENKSKMSHDYTKTVQSFGTIFFKDLWEKYDQADTFAALSDMIFTFSDVMNALRKKIDDFEKVTEQFCYIFYLLHLPGAVYQREYLLIELNKVIKRVSTDLNETQCMEAVDELFILFADFKKSNLNLILDSIQYLGKEIINTQNKKIIHHFEDELIKFGFIAPGVAYMTNDWELKVNPCHVKNIRVWLELIEYDPETMSKLLSALIIHLRIGGIFIFDTDFFQKDITKLLNSKVAPMYKQIKQLTRIFPVYFNEIGAEGHLRTVSTKVDEISFRNDKLIHFLRKQVHTEGNNSHIQITQEIIRFWYDLNKKRLKSILPPNVFDLVDVHSEWVVGVHEVLVKICENNHISLDDLLEKDKDEIAELIKNIQHDNSNDIERVSLIIELYQLLKEKYIFETNNISTILHRYHFIDSADVVLLEDYLDNNNHVEALKLIYSFMVKLNNIIFDPKKSEGWENVFYKRHIAFGIPSMYGYYKEEKFDALGLTFRLERIASILITNIIETINTEYFTIKTFKDIYAVMEYMREGLSLDGIYNQGFDSHLKMLKYSLTSGCFTIKQYINIFQFMEASLKEITNSYFIRPYEQLLQTIIPQYLTEKEKEENNLRKIIMQKSEIFYRELLSSAFIIQALDNLIGEILNNLRRQISVLSDSELQGIMSYDPELTVSPIYAETPNIDNQVFLGSKAYYLKTLFLKDYPVPPGFVLTTEIFRRLDSILKVPSLTNEINQLVKTNVAELERMTGKKYGDPSNPLLLSVRSGAAISMPGAMNTFLNVGLNDEITEKLSQMENFGWTSWDCYRRLLQTWGMSYGLDRNDFDQIIINFKQKYHVTQKLEFKPAMMREIAFAYKQLLIDNNIRFEEDPFEQLKTAIVSVFNSWDTPRAKVYRNHMQIANEWGTAVIVMKMIFGNLHLESGSGVVFTHDVHDTEDVINLTGDFSFISQGEDIVAGLVNTLPISENQRLKYYHNCEVSLESAYPKIYNKLRDIASQMIETHGFSHQEIEFTFETSQPEDLFILQTRNMNTTKKNVIEVFDIQKQEMIRVGGGIGIGNRVMNGLTVFDLGDVAKLKEKFPDQKAVLVRPDTVPDDIEIIFECEGLLTGKGGSTSHAAVTAAALGKIGVVNCNDMIVYEKEKKCVITGHEFHLFDPIAIDGANGIIYQGNYPIKIQEL